MYHVYGQYPQAEFYYDVEADVAKTDWGWCDYSASGLGNLVNVESIDVENGLQMILAYVRDNAYLDTGESLRMQINLTVKGHFVLFPRRKILVRRIRPQALLFRMLYGRLTKRRITMPDSLPEAPLSSELACPVEQCHPPNRQGAILGS